MKGSLKSERISLIPNLPSFLLLPDKTDLIAYPNPTTGTVQINFRELVVNGVFDLYDQLGKLISRETSVNGLSTTVDLSDFAPGIYSAKMQNGSKLSTLRIVKR
ncbi:MAG: T9SS type A sorting domain-containing protein [Flavobacteriales bacterium]|nr:T9SS type A sorting domain-containing protein [Flavobacteriales bacterium]